MPSGPELCPKCKGLHYRRDPCIVRKPKSEEIKCNTIGTSELGKTTASGDGLKDCTGPTAQKTKRSSNRHRPGYFTEYMRDYRKGIRRRKKDG